MTIKSLFLSLVLLLSSSDVGYLPVRVSITHSNCLSLRERVCHCVSVNALIVITVVSKDTMQVEDKFIVIRSN